MHARFVSDRVSASTNVEPIKVSKIEAANRQLDAAIELLFAEGDPIAVHTLAGAASVLAADLVEVLRPERSWDKRAQEDTGLTAKQFFAIARDTQNFLKHAKDDPAGVLEFSVMETEYLIFWTILNLTELLPSRETKLSTPQSAFQLWFIAARSDLHDPSRPVFKAAIEYVGDLRERPRSEQLGVGRELLAKWHKHRTSRDPDG